LIDGSQFILLGGKKVEEGNNGSFEFSSRVSSDGDWAKSSPNNVLANVGGDEERDTRSKSISLLHHFIEHDDDDSGEDKLEDDEHGISEAEVRQISVSTRPDVSESFTNANDERKNLKIRKILNSYAFGLP
jgi:hypothetical protein